MRQIRKISSIMIIGMLIIITMMLIKYKPVYAVAVEQENIGYIENKRTFTDKIKGLTEKKEENIAFISLETELEYEWKLINRKQQTNEDVVLAKMQENLVTTYVRYAVTLDGENKGYAKTQEEAEAMVEEIKQEFEDKIELNLAVIKEYTENPEEMNQVDVELAKTNIDQEIEETIEEENKRKNSSVNGVLLASKPVSGIVSSRFGATNGRDHSHKGIDIAAPTGTPIYACGDGTVTRAGWSNGYGNLVVISHGNGVETYYGHCSQLYVTKGQTVSSGSKIAAVGSTGRSTGPHLHLEIRKNGSQINPQTIFYK